MRRCPECPVPWHLLPVAWHLSARVLRLMPPTPQRPGLPFPLQYITLLFTDLGVLTPAAVSDELIQLYV